MAALLAFTLAACGGSSSGGSSTSDAPRNPYVWNKISYNNGRYSYAVDGKVVSRIGVDVSDHQGTIDWNAVAADGVDFAFIRIGRRGYTEGGIYPDDCFEQNLSGAQAAGLDVGVYFFSQAVSEEEAVEEAEFVIKTLKGRWLALPVVFDEETVSSANGRANRLSKVQRTANARAFLERVESAGYSGMLYCNQNDMARINLNELSQWPVWYAEYGEMPGPTPDFTIWQFTSTGKVSGISGSADVNIDLSGAR